MYASHHGRRDMCAECGNCLEQSEGLGDDFRDFRAYLGAKTAHQIRTETAAAAHKETMHVHIDKNWDLMREEKKLKAQLRSLSADLAAKKGFMLSLKARSNEMLGTLQTARIEIDRMHMHRTAQMASFSGYS